MSVASRICTVVLSGLMVGAGARAATVVDNTTLNNAQDGSNWPAFGRTFSEDHTAGRRRSTTATSGAWGWRGRWTWM